MKGKKRKPRVCSVCNETATTRKCRRCGGFVDTTLYCSTLHGGLCDVAPATPPTETPGDGVR